MRLRLPPWMRRLVLTLLASLLVAAPASAAEEEPAAVLRAQGLRMYREGLRPSGEALVATGAAQATLSGKEAACVACHRRSGYGSSEGPITIRPITGPALSQELSTAVRSPRIKARLGSRVRPAYTDELLARALRSGLDAAGKPLDRAMPRYALSDAEVSALAAYLHGLSSAPSPGVDEQEIHFATVIQPGVSSGQRHAMLDVMQAFVRDKDANMRLDEQRRAVGNMRMYRAYRKWVLHVWELSGPPESWTAQLEARYAEQPVFALLGGLGSADWEPIQAFSEQHEIPCVLPQIGQPPAGPPGQYTFYFSRGAVLEAEVLARFLREQGSTGRLVQVYRPQQAGAAAAAALRRALAPRTELAVQDLLLDGPADAAFWQRVAQSQPALLVLWLGADDLAQANLPAGSIGVPVYLSYQLSAGLPGGPPPGLAGMADLRLLYPSDLPPRHEARLLRGRHWLVGKGLVAADEAVQLNTLFTMAIVSDVIGHLAGSYSRDYFVERLEHAVGQSTVPSIYPQLSLGPGQRYAAKGAQVVRLQEAGRGGLQALSSWIVP